jgi:hypothetical protein
MENLMIHENKGDRRRSNPAYRKLLNRLVKTQKPQQKKERKILRALMRQIPVGDPMDEKYRRVRYVRYADTFLISVIGPHSLAVYLKQQVHNFLQDHLWLKISDNQIRVIPAKKGKAYFLGTEIFLQKPSLKKVVLSKTRKKTRVTGLVILKAPIDKLLKRLVANKFLKWNPSGTQIIPTALTSITNIPHADILIYYNKVMRGILNYYSFADNRSSLGVVVRMLRLSCALTLALKYKLRFGIKAFKKFGKDLTCPDKGVKLYRPGTLARIRKFAA